MYYQCLLQGLEVKGENKTFLDLRDYNNGVSPYVLNNTLHPLYCTDNSPSRLTVNSTDQENVKITINDKIVSITRYNTNTGYQFSAYPVYLLSVFMELLSVVIILRKLPD